MRLNQAKWHVTVGEEGIPRQRAVIDELERDGHDTTLVSYSWASKLCRRCMPRRPSV
jgi:hypothetical protein